MNLATARTIVLNHIHKERERQDKKWGQEDHPDELWMTILMEEVGELAKSILEHKIDDHVYGEAIQCAAVAIAFAEHIIVRQNQLILNLPVEQPMGKPIVDGPTIRHGLDTINSELKGPFDE